jgi:hypothetical protein
MKRSLENLGYHTALIFVNTSLRTAMQRNSQRSRRVPGALVADAHKQVQDSLPALKSEFGKDYIEINSDSSDVFDRDIASAKKQLDSFISKPHTKDAKAWINSAKLDKVSEEEEPRFKHESDVDIPRKEMPQINIKHVKHNYRVVKGRLALDKIKPSQSQRVPGLTNKVIDRLYKGKMKNKPLIVDKNGYLVNGHHRLDALKHLGAEKTNVVMVDATLQELIKDFEHTASDVFAESFNQPYPVKVIQSPDSDDYEAALRLPDGTGMEILFTEHGGIWDMEFYRGGSQDVTGDGDAFRIFATMMEAVRQFIRMEKPGAVSFTATKDVPEGQDPESRAKLYTRMVERFADSLGYQAYIDDYGDMVEYELVSKKHVSEGFTKPQLDVEWEEAQRYPEFRKIGKEAWIKLAGKGKAVTITDASDINNTDAADPDSFKALDPAKQKRALAQVEKGDVELPVVAVYSDGYKELIGGNTRLTAMMAKHGKGIVWQFEVPDEVAVLGENFKDGKVKGKSRPGRVKKAGASCKGSVSSLRAKAKKYSGEKGKMYHWCANMKSGKSKK